MKQIVNGKCVRCGTPAEAICRCEVAEFRDSDEDQGGAGAGGEEESEQQEHTSETVCWLITPHSVLCPQCKTFVQKKDFEPRAGMCGACISEAIAEVPEFFARGGLVASHEENEHND